MGSLAQQGAGGGGESREAVASLARAIAALHSYLDLVRDPKSRATATQCLARLEQLRGDHMPDNSQAGSGAPQGGQAPGSPY